jgi:virulence-associated protein VapD
MFAIAFDLVVAETQLNHPKGVAQAYSDIRDTLTKFEFDWVQGSLYVSKNEDMAKLFTAIMALRSLPWFPPSVRDIRAFRVEQWSDFTQVVKSRDNGVPVA